MHDARYCAFDYVLYQRYMEQIESNPHSIDIMTKILDDYKESIKENYTDVYQGNKIIYQKYYTKEEILKNPICGLSGPDTKWHPDNRGENGFTENDFGV